VILIVGGALYWLVYAAIAYTVFVKQRRKVGAVRVANAGPDSLIPNPES
jgi:hypothetical protein